MIGIEKIHVHPCVASLSIEALCRARGLDPGNFVGRLFCEERSVVGPVEDVVTLAVNAARPLLTEEDARAVRLLIVATESSVDQEKPVSSWVHHYLGLPSSCRNFEVKHACYGGTAAMQMACTFLATEPEAKALVVSADHAFLGIEGPQEPVLGAGAAAVLLSAKPRLIAYEPGASGVFAHEVADIFRPSYGLETGDADESLTSYLDAAEETYAAYLERLGRAVDFDQHFAANVYHVPFGGLAQRAHLRLARKHLGLSRADAERHFERKSLASLTHNRRMGGVYGASTFVALLGLVENSPQLQAGERIGFYSYGSGSCAEFYSAILLPEAREVAREARLGPQLDARRRLTVPEYEACERALHQSLAARDYRPPRELLPGLYEEHYVGRGRLVFRGIAEWRRHYEWS